VKKERNEIESTGIEQGVGFFSEIVLFVSSKLVILSQCRLNLGKKGGGEVRLKIKVFFCSAFARQSLGNNTKLTIH
jgi:hypothetical protein